MTSRKADTESYDRKPHLISRLNKLWVDSSQILRTRGLVDVYSNICGPCPNNDLIEGRHVPVRYALHSVHVTTDTILAVDSSFTLSSTPRQLSQSHD